VYGRWGMEERNGNLDQVKEGKGTEVSSSEVKAASYVLLPIEKGEGRKRNSLP